MKKDRVYFVFVFIIVKPDTIILKIPKYMSLWNHDAQSQF